MTDSGKDEKEKTTKKTTPTVIVLSEEDKPKYNELLAEFKGLKVKEKEAQDMLYKAMEGRNARVENCLKQCGEVFSKSKEAYHGLKQKTHKENM